MAIIAERLKEFGHTGRLIYEDRQGGDRLALTVECAEALVELQVHRSGAGATLVLLGESQPAIVEFEKALDDYHRKLPRRHNAKRKFVHRVERMAEHLLTTFDQRRQQFPNADFKSFATWVPGSIPLVGVQTRFRTKEKEEGGSSFDPTKWFEGADAKLKREAHKYPSRFGAKVTASGLPRAALYGGAGFMLGGTAITQAMVANVAPAKGAQLTGPDAIDVGGVALDTAELAWDAGALLGELGGSGLDALADAKATSGDCGGIDLPDCDIVDVPDCSGCDCAV